MKTPNARTIRLASIVGILALTGLGWWVHGFRFESTDNAYTAAHVAALSPKVGGLVREVLVEENMRVKRGQVLARLEDRDYRNALNDLRAQLGAAEASAALARKDYARFSTLFSQGVVTEQMRDNARTKLEELEKKRDGLRAQTEQAELNLAYTEIRAPADGTIGKKLAEAGVVAAPGQPLLSFVDAQAPWVVANFKETQLRKMKLGQRVEIEIDSIAGKVFAGEIESFAPGTGATFALIPPDNATGNFTKIVQRVPVKIRFEEGSIAGYEDRIIPGLSVEARVDIASAAREPVKTAPTLASERTVSLGE